MTDRSETICVIGLWHLGTVLSACWADLGHRVVGVDESRAVVAALAEGRAPLFEPGLDALIRENLTRGRLSFSVDLTIAVAVPHRRQRTGGEPRSKRRSKNSPRT